MRTHFKHLRFKKISMELFNPINFDFWNYSLKIQKSIRTPIPKVRAHLGVCAFISSFSYTPGNIKCDSWASFTTHIFASPCLGHEPKTRVITPNGENLVAKNINNLRSNPNNMVHVESHVN